jgi:hypothetical protein
MVNAGLDGRRVRIQAADDVLEVVEAMVPLLDQPSL